MDVDILEPGTALHLYSEDAPDLERTWVVGKFLGRGGSSVCYQAKCGTKTGRLKEFLPCAHKSNGRTRRVTLGFSCIKINRDKEGQLYFDNETDRKKFIMMRDSFLSSYRVLDKIKQDKKGGGILNNYVPPFLILFGKSGAETNGAYIWTPDDKHGQTFDEYILENIDIDENEPEKRLYYILKVILGLTDCTCVFHSVGLLNYDIKPSNFLIPFNRSRDIESGNISLFDINTLTLIGTQRQDIKVTDGYSAPELYHSDGDNRSDIFSIGAVLYTAIMSDDSRGMVYFDEKKYKNIPKDLSDARIVVSSKVNSSTFMTGMLTKILRGCLNRYPDSRYPDCEALIADLKACMTYLLPAVESGTLGQQKKLVVVDMQEQINPIAVIQNVIYTHPLYKYLEEGQDLKVLVIGNDSYAKTFIDLTLQHGQLIDQRLSIKVLCKDAGNARIKYLADRPGLMNYIKRDGNRVTLSFEEMGESDSDRDKKITRILCEKERRINYCFISDGDDEQNRDTARFCSLVAGEAGYHAIFAYRMENENLKAGKTGIPVYVYREFDKAVKRKLKSMAYRVHCIWNGSGNDEISKKQFRIRYNAESSLNFAIAIKYKMHSIGIDDEDEDIAAKKYVKVKNREDIISMLSALEHRRWSMDLLTKGWSAPKETRFTDFLEGSINRGVIKDKNNKLHHCLVPSTAATPLKTSEWDALGKQRWDVPGDYDSELDPLDRVSVEIHRFFKAKADIIPKLTSNDNPDILRLKDIINMAGGSTTAIECLDMFSKNISKVQTGDRKAALSYEMFFKEFKDSLSKDRNLKNYLKLIEDRLELIYRDVFIMAEGGMYRDFKAYDEMLIKNMDMIMSDT